MPRKHWLASLMCAHACRHRLPQMQGMLAAVAAVGAMAQGAAGSGRCGRATQELQEAAGWAPLWAGQQQGRAGPAGGRQLVGPSPLPGLPFKLPMEVCQNAQHSSASRHGSWKEGQRRQLPVHKKVVQMRQGWQWEQ